MSINWDSFLWNADDWFVAYASSIHHGSHSVRLYIVGHAVELYLKAVFTKLCEDINKAISCGHDIKKLFDEIRKIDDSFLREYEIRENILKEDWAQPNWRFKLSKNDLEQLEENMELYTIAKGLADLKYIGAPFKTKGFSIVGVCTIFPNPYWTEFIKKIRIYLDYPIENRRDPIRSYVNNSDSKPEIVNYLQEVLNC